MKQVNFERGVKEWRSDGWRESGENEDDAVTRVK